MNRQRPRKIVIGFLVFFVIFVIALLWYLTDWEADLAQGAVTYAFLTMP